MAVTSTGVDTGTWSSDLRNFMFDVGRAKLIDVETDQDENNVPDRVDVATGNAGAQSRDPWGGLVSNKNGIIAVVGAGLAMIIAAIAIKKMAG